MATALREVLAHFGITVDSAPLEKGDKLVDGFKEKLLGMGKVVAGAFAVSELVSFGREILNQADALAKQSTALGVSVEQLQGWQHAAQLSGSSAEGFTSAFTKFNKNVAEAADSATGPAAEAFKALGVNIKDASGELGAPIDLLDGVADALAGMEDPAKRTKAVMDLFGKSGAELLPLFSEGAEGIAKLRAEVGELGASFDEAFLQDAQEFNDNIDRLKLGLKGLFIQAIGPLLPELASMTKSMVGAIKAGVAWLKSTRLVQAVITGFTVKGVLALAQAIPLVIAKMGGWRLAFATLGRFVLRTLAPLVLLEDAIGFLNGDDSLLGRGLDKAFGPGTQEKVRSWIENTIGEFNRLSQNADAAYVKLGDSNQSWLNRTIAGLALLRGGSQSTWAAISEGWASVWVGAKITFAEFAVWVDETWNALMGKLHLPDFMKIDTAEGQGRVDDLKRTKDALDAKAYRRENQQGEFETPEVARQRAANAAAGVGEMRDADLSPLQKMAAQYMQKVQLGGGPGGGPYRLDEEGRYAPGAIEKPYVPGTAYQAFAAPPPTASPTPASYTDQSVDVGGIRVNQQISVAPDTTEEQARELGRGAAKGFRDVWNTRQLQDSLYHTAG